MKVPLWNDVLFDWTLKINGRFVFVCLSPLPHFMIKKIGSHICFLSLSWAGRFFDWPFPSNHFYCFQNVYFHLKFYLSHFSVVCKGGYKWHNKPCQKVFCTWGGICNSGWCTLGRDLFSGFIWIFVQLSFFHIQFSFSKRVAWRHFFALFIVELLLKLI